MAEAIGVQGRGVFYDKTGAIRDVIQNHMLQILAYLTMEPPAGPSSESIQDAKANLIKQVRTLDPKNVVRGQFVGYQDEPGVAADSQTETFAAVRLEIDSPRWLGVPFLVRAGKRLPVSCIEVVVNLRPSKSSRNFDAPKSNYMRFRISPEASIALGVMTLGSGETMAGDEVELLACHHPNGDEIGAYERLLGEAMKGDRGLFAREDYVEEEWRIVDPVLGSAAPLYPYQPDTWGPSEADRIIAEVDRWHDPKV